MNVALEQPTVHVSASLQMINDSHDPVEKYTYGTYYGNTFKIMQAVMHT